MSGKTFHVIPWDDGWTVTREGGKKSPLFSTQREAIESAKAIVRSESSGQLVVHGRDRRIRKQETYGMPPIKQPPGKRSLNIERAVDRITRRRLGLEEPVPPRG